MNTVVTAKRLLVFESHPVQYHAPVYQAAAALGVDVVACYGSDFSVAGCVDQEFNTAVSWDTDLLSGYEHHFLSRVVSGGAREFSSVSDKGLPEVIARINPAAILVNGYTSRFDRASIRAAVKSKLPMLLRAETTDHAIRRSPLKSAIRDFVLRRLYARCHRLLYIGTRSLNHYLRLGVPNAKLISSPYCVSEASFQPDEEDRVAMRAKLRSAYDIPKDEFLLLYSGKLVPRKGVDLLMPALRRLHDESGCSITLGLLGDGELRSALEREAAAHPQVNVRFFGFQNQSQMSPFYHASDAVVLPSLNSETWGLVVNESLLHGVPAVVSDNVGCALDLVREGVTGSVCRAGDVDSLANSLRKVILMSRNETMRQGCRGAVEAYSVDSAARGIAQAVQEAVR